ncbi:MAG: GerMN domain-containing protein [Selenomonadaceae bacterium]|nr:GerMN domain-containing protein [Selenomonadaceae bacterium]
MVKKIFISAMTAMLLLTTGCNKNVPPEITPSDNPKQAEAGIPKIEIDDNPTPQVTKTENGVTTMQVTVYYPDQAGMSLIPVKREIKFKDANQKYIEAVKCLLDSPTEEELTKIFPKDAKIKSIKLDGNTAVIDLDSGITKNFVGGSTGEEFLINSVVDTLTEFDEVKQVRFLIDGKEVETLAGHMDLSEPIKR